MGDGKGRIERGKWEKGKKGRKSRGKGVRERGKVAGQDASRRKLGGWEQPSSGQWGTQGRGPGDGGPGAPAGPSPGGRAPAQRPRPRPPPELPAPPSRAPPPPRFPASLRPPSKDPASCEVAGELRGAEELRSWERSTSRAGSGPAPGAHRSGRAARAAPAAGSSAPAAGRNVQRASGRGAQRPGRAGQDRRAPRAAAPGRAGWGADTQRFQPPRLASPRLRPHEGARAPLLPSTRAVAIPLAAWGTGDSREGRENRMPFPCRGAPWKPQLALDFAGAVEAPLPFHSPADSGGPRSECLGAMCDFSVSRSAASR